MKPISFEEGKAVGLGILKELHAYCEAHHLTYCLAYGTLLGAIRHQGYIPWDDDIDVFLPIEDYKELVKNYRSDRFEIVDCSNNDKHYITWGKMCDKTTVKKERVNAPKGYEIGFNIDLFPLYPFQDETAARTFWDETITIRKKIRYCVVKSKFPPKDLLFLGYRIQGPANCRRYIAMLEERSKPNGATYVSEFIYANKCDSEIFPKGIFSKLELRAFEGSEFYVPSRYDECLRILYGDYMQLPPPQQQIPHHLFDAWYKD